METDGSVLKMIDIYPIFFSQSPMGAGTSFADEFHTYVMEWTDTDIKWVNQCL